MEKSNLSVFTFIFAFIFDSLLMAVLYFFDWKTGSAEPCCFCVPLSPRHVYFPGVQLHTNLSEPDVLVKRQATMPPPLDVSASLLARYDAASLGALAESFTGLQIELCFCSRDSSIIELHEGGGLVKVKV